MNPRCSSSGTTVRCGAGVGRGARRLDPANPWTISRQAPNGFRRCAGRLREEVEPPVLAVNPHWHPSALKHPLDRKPPEILHLQEEDGSADGRHVQQAKNIVTQNPADSSLITQLTVALSTPNQNLAPCLNCGVSPFETGRGLEAGADR